MTTKLELQKQIDELQAKLDAMPEDKPPGRWRPTVEGEEYWIVGVDKGVVDTFFETGCRIDEHRIAMGNCYKTEKDALAAMERQLATVRVLDRIAELNAEQGWVCDWSGNGYRYHLGWRCGIPCCVGAAGDIQTQPTTYYGSKETIGTVIKEMPGDIKLMLGVES